MKISELPPGLKQLAKLRREKCKVFLSTEDDLFYAFMWRTTPEKDSFWREVYQGNFTPFYNCKVVNFKLKDFKD